MFLFFLCDSFFLRHIGWDVEEEAMEVVGFSATVHTTATAGTGAVAGGAVGATLGSSAA